MFRCLEYELGDRWLEPHVGKRLSGGEKQCIGIEPLLNKSAFDLSGQHFLRYSIELERIRSSHFLVLDDYAGLLNANAVRRSWIPVPYLNPAHVARAVVSVYGSACIMTLSIA